MANRRVGLELCVAVGFIAAAAPALADPLYCSTSFQGYRGAPRRAATGRPRRNGGA